MNASELKDELGRRGSIFQTSTDTEVILHLYARSRASNTDDAIVEAISHVQGAFSLALMTKDRLIAIRESSGFRPPPSDVSAMRDRCAERARST